MYDELIISDEAAENIPHNKLVYLVAKVEGDELYNLDKIANGKHDKLQFTENDTVIFATHAIVHNQRQAQNLKDKLSRLVYTYYIIALLKLTLADMATGGLGVYTQENAS